MYGNRPLHVSKIATVCLACAVVCRHEHCCKEDDTISEIQLLASGYDVDLNELFNPDLCYSILDVPCYSSC